MGKIRKTNTNSRNLRTDTLINQYDPTTSNLLKIAWTQHCVPNVRRAYKSATKSYSMYCREIKVPPWPATDIKIAAWLIRISTNVKFTSMNMYLCGVRNLKSFDWCEGIRGIHEDAGHARNWVGG